MQTCRVHKLTCRSSPSASGEALKDEDLCLRVYPVNNSYNNTWVIYWLLKALLISMVGMLSLKNHETHIATCKDIRGDVAQSATNCARTTRANSLHLPEKSKSATSGIQTHTADQKHQSLSPELRMGDFLGR